MSTYHVTGIFLLDDPAQTPTQVFISALHGNNVVDTAVIVCTTRVGPALQGNLDKLMAQAGVQYHLVLRDEQQTLADQLAQHLDASIETAQAAGKEPWLWFLTDDTVVTPNSLEKQLQAVEISPSVGITGAKQLRGRHIHNVGLTVAHNGDILSLIEPGELDQGQHDHRTDVFAVDLPSMLIKAELFKTLGGFDEHTPRDAQTVDLCWRARLAGHRVAIVPEAVAQHGKPSPELSLTQRWEQGRWLALKHTGRLGMIGTWLWSLVLALGLLVGGLILKAPSEGFARARGIFKALAQPVALLKARKAARQTRTRSYDVIDELRPTRARVRDHRRSILEDQRPDSVIGDGTGVSDHPYEATGGHDDFDQIATPDRNWVGIGAVTLLLVLGAIALLGLRHLLGVPALAGGNLLPISHDIPTLISKAASGWALTGAGAPGFAGPFGWLLVLAGLTTNASVVFVWLWILALPLAGFSAWKFVGAITRNRYIRFAAGLVWAGLPAFLTALSEGRLGGVLVHLLLPWFALAILRAVAYRPAEQRRNAPAHRISRWTPAAWTAILLAVLTAAAPALFVPLTAVVIVTSVVFRQRTKRLWWTPILAATTLLPAAVSHAPNLRAIFADPGAPAGFLPAPAWQLLLGIPHEVPFDGGTAELPWLDMLSPAVPWAGIIMVLLAVPVIFLSILGVFATGQRGKLARGAMLIALIGVTWAILSGNVVFAVDQTGTPVPLSTIPAVSLAWLGLLVAAVIGTNINNTATAKKPTQQGAWFPTTATSLLVVTSILAIGIWFVPRVIPAPTMAQAQQESLAQRNQAATEAATDELVTNPTRAQLRYLTGQPTVTGVLQRSLPATAADAARSELRTRSVVLTQTREGFRTHLISGDGTMLEDMNGTWTTRGVTGPLFAPTTSPTDDADDMLRTVAAQLTTGADTDPRPALEALGAGFVVLTDPAGTEESLAAAIDSVPGLAAVGHTQAGWLWRVVPETQESTDEDASTTAGVPVLTSEGTGTPRGTHSGRARILSEDGHTIALVASAQNGAIDVELPASEAPRQLVLAERANPGFQATLNGVELNGVVSSPDWVQAFELPATGGELEVRYAPTAGTWMWLIPGALLVATLILGIPTRARPSNRSNEES